MSKSRILVVEDDPMTAAALRLALSRAGYVVEVAGDGYRALAQALVESYDLIILDWLLPDLEGVELCRRLRRERQVPIILLTAKADIQDRVTGLRAGADDYLIKPIDPEELLARVEARLRYRQLAPEELRYADLVLWPTQQKLYRNGQEVPLTRREFQLLHQFMKQPDVILSRDQLQQVAWGSEGQRNSNVLEAYIRLLRKKLEASGGGRLIHTVHAVGYVLRESGAETGGSPA